MRKKIIYGCEGRGDGNDPYLTRFTIFDVGPALYVHVFHRSDHDVMHDHPWPFWTLILWRGYVEHTPDKPPRRLWPFTLHRRPAEWIHRVELIDRKRAVTLVLRGRVCRVWGFHLPDGWVGWQFYFRLMGCKD